MTPTLADWEHDHAHQAIEQWITAWRTTRTRSSHPVLSFGSHLGREAVRMQDEGMDRTEMLRIFAACGYDGVCVCGLKPGDPIPAKEGKR